MLDIKGYILFLGIWLCVCTLCLLYWLNREDRFIKAREVKLTCEVVLFVGAFGGFSIANLLTTESPSCTEIFLWGNLSILMSAFPYMLLLQKILRRYVVNTPDFKFEGILGTFTVKFTHTCFFGSKKFTRNVRVFQVCLFGVIVSGAILSFVFDEPTHDLISCYLGIFPSFIGVLAIALFSVLAIFTHGFMAILFVLSIGTDRLGIQSMFRSIVRWMILGVIVYSATYILFVCFQIMDLKFYWAAGPITIPIVYQFIIRPLLQKRMYTRYNGFALLSSKINTRIGCFEQYINSKEGFEMYLDFLQDELSSESLLFIHDVSHVVHLFEYSTEEQESEEHGGKLLIFNKLLEVVKKFLLPNSPSLINAASAELDSVRRITRQPRSSYKSKSGGFMRQISRRFSVGIAVGPDEGAKSNVEHRINSIIENLKALYQGQIEMLVSDSFPRFLCIEENLKSFEYFEQLNRDLDLA